VQTFTPRNTIGDTNAADNAVVYQGTSLMLRAVVGANVDEECGGGLLCALDMPVCYDVLDGVNPFHLAGSPTLYGALVNAGRSSLVAPGDIDALIHALFAGEEIECAALPRLTMGLEHPVTGALWIVRGSSLYEYGRTGVQVRADDAGRCLSSYVRLPCPPCQWAPSVGGCASCVAMREESDVGWQQACAACDSNNNVTGGSISSSRRTLALSLLRVTYTVGSNATADPTNFSAAVAARGAECTPLPNPPLVMPRLLSCDERTADPQQAIRTLNALVAATGGYWSVVSAPHVVYDSASLLLDRQATGNNKEEVVSAPLLSPLVVVLVSIGVVGAGVGVVMCVCRRDRRHQHRRRRNEADEEEEELL
jgi:hypothetical protein